MNLIAFYYAKKLFDLLEIKPKHWYIYDVQNCLNKTASQKEVIVCWIERDDQCVVAQREDYDIQISVGFDTKTHWLQPDPLLLRSIYNLLMRNFNGVRKILQISHYSPDYIYKELRNEPVIIISNSGNLVRHLNSKGIIESCASGWLTGVIS